MDKLISEGTANISMPIVKMEDTMLYGYYNLDNGQLKNEFGSSMTVVPKSRPKGIKSAKDIETIVP